MKQITPAQHLAALDVPYVVVTPVGPRKGERIEYKRFAKSGEQQADAIRRLKRQLRDRIRQPDTRKYPPVEMSTKAYVEFYYSINGLGTPPYKDLSSNAQERPLGPEVEFFEVDDDVSDLI